MPKRMIRITETNEIASIFNTSEVRPSDDLPEWFAPLRYVVEDDGFVNLTITLGSVHYLLSVEGQSHEPEPLSSTSATVIEAEGLQAVDVSLRLLAGQIINLRTELMATKANVNAIAEKLGSREEQER